ncbi:MAG TPA: hypothetical protein VGR57_09565 [Ktedonobacterales bacterium]|nr:hypothetical protein [Ktedonobacterales bacterium]
MATAQRDPRTATHGRWLAWGSFVASLVWPLTYLFVVAVVALRDLAPSGGSPFIVSLYTVFDYFEWPFPLLAVVLGHVALARGGPGRRAAVSGLVLGYLATVTLIGTVLALSSRG